MFCNSTSFLRSVGHHHMIPRPNCWHGCTDVTSGEYAEPRDHVHLKTTSCKPNKDVRSVLVILPSYMHVMSVLESPVCLVDQELKPFGFQQPPMCSKQCTKGYVNSDVNFDCNGLLVFSIWEVAKKAKNSYLECHPKVFEFHVSSAVSNVVKKPKPRFFVNNRGKNDTEVFYMPLSVLECVFFQILPTLSYIFEIFCAINFVTSYKLLLGFLVL